MHLVFLWQCLVFGHDGELFHLAFNCEVLMIFRERLLQDQLRREQESVSNMKKLHERAQSQLFEVRAQSGEYDSF